MQIQSSVQHATILVNSYPRPIDCNKLLEFLAQKHSEPSTHILMNPSGVDDLQLAANWDTCHTYMSSLCSENVHVHCPMLHPG